jgi:acyl carrier protein
VSSLEQLVAEVLKLPESDINDDTGPAVTGQWTSVEHVRIIAAVAREFGILITPRQARSCRTVGDLRKLVAGNGSPR